MSRNIQVATSTYLGTHTRCIRFIVYLTRPVQLSLEDILEHSVRSVREIHQFNILHWEDHLGNTTFH
jgi:hypothetical protein